MRNASSSHARSGKRHVMRGSIDLTLTLPPVPEAAGRARHTLRTALEDRFDPETLGDAELLVTELVTNAVRHGALRPGDDIKVKVHGGDDHVCVEVSDPGVGFPHRPHMPRPDRAGGFGLFLLDRMARMWGVSRPPTRVWFELATSSNAREEPLE